jgi:hypothetical protein
MYFFKVSGPCLELDNIDELDETFGDPSLAGKLESSSSSSSGLGK